MNARPNKIGKMESTGTVVVMEIRKYIHVVTDADQNSKIYLRIRLANKFGFGSTIPEIREAEKSCQICLKHVRFGQ